MFLGYGRAVETLLANYIDDLVTVLAGFVIMAGAFVSQRLGRQLWNDFVADVERARAFSTSPYAVWS